MKNYIVWVHISLLFIILYIQIIVNLEIVALKGSGADESKFSQKKVNKKKSSILTFPTPNVLSKKKKLLISVMYC